MEALGRPSIAAEARIERPAVASDIARGLARGSVVLVADAGFGKTTALQDALATAGLPAAWVVCEPGQREPGRLLVAVIAALQRAVPGLADVPAERLAAPEAIDAAALAHEAAEECARLLADPLVLVLDDAEALDGAPALDEVVSPLLAAAGPLRLAIASRRPLALPLARLRAAGRVSEIGPERLAFDAGECAAILLVRRGITASPGEIAEVLHTTEGWPLGVALLASVGDGVPATHTRAELLAYLEQELLDALEPHVRAELATAALCAELDPGAARALGLPDDVLAEAPALAGFVSVTGRGRRLHPLLRELLLRDEARRPAGRRRADRAALAAARADQGRDAEAIELWLDAGRSDEAAAAIARAGPATVRAAPGTVERWLERLPPGASAAPALTLLRAQVEARAGAPAAPARFDAAIRGFQAAGDAAGEWHARLLLIDHLHLRGDLPGVLATSAAGGTPGPDAGPGAVGALFYRAAGFAMRGAFAESDALGALLVELGGEPLVPLEAVRRCWLDAPRGRYHDSAQRLREALATLERADPLNHRAVVLSSLAMVLNDAGELAASEAVWVETARSAERDGREPVHRGIAQLYLAQLRGRSGDPDGAEDALARAGALERYGFRGHLGHAAVAHVAAARGAEGEAVAAARRALEVAGTGTPLDRLWALEAVAPLLDRLGATADASAAAASTLDEIDACFPGADGTYARARVLCVRAWLHRGDEAAALADVGTAWELAGPARPGLLRGHRGTLPPLLDLAMRHGIVAPADGLAALAAADPASRALLGYVADPDPALRLAAVAPAAASGRPEVARALEGRAEDPEPAIRVAARDAAARLAAHPLPLALRTLGGFEVRRGPSTVDRAEWGRPHAATLVRYLLVQGDAAVSEEALFAALWPDRAGATARGALHVAVSRARAVLGAERIESAQRTYRLRLGPDDGVDASRFSTAAAAALRAAGPERPGLLEHAAALWGGEPLPEDRGEPWATAWRERLTGAYRAVLTALVAACEDAADHGGATLAAARLVALDPLDESAHRSLMRAYARGGRRAHALRAFLDCRHSLVAGQGIEPDFATTRLQARILAGERV